jgi:polysaccharide biosynthesis transport protein
MNRIIATAMRHWLPLLSLNLLVLGATYLIISRQPKVWTANAEMILPNTTSDLNANLGTLGNISSGKVVFSQQLNPLKILSSILLSNDTLIEAQKFDPQKDEYANLTAFRELFDVSPQGETTVISMSANGSSPEVARKRLDNLITVFQSRLNKLRAEDASERANFIQKELNQARLNLVETQRMLTNFKKSANLVSSEDQTREMVISINTLTRDRAQVQAEFQASQAQVKMLSSRLELSPEKGIRSLRLKENQNYQYIQKKLPEVETELMKLQVSYTNEYPQVKKLLSERNQLRQQLENYIAEAAGGEVGINTSIGSDSAVLIQQLALAESQTKALGERAKQLQMETDKLQQLLVSLPVAQSNLLELQRQYNIAEGVYNGLVAKVQEAKLNAFSTYPNVQTLTLPSVDPNPSGSKRKAIALGGILASAFGSVAIVLLLESRNPLLSWADLQELEIPVLSNIPRLKHSAMEVKLKSEAVLEFQRLASAVSMMQLEKGCLMITSATASEGKTTVTLGLAKALLTLGFRVLIVDGDFRKAQLSKHLGYSPVEMNGSLPIPVNLAPNFDLVPTAPQGDEIIEFIARGGFKEFLKSVQAKNKYDYVLVDSAPLTLTSETALMTTAISNVLLVTCLGNSDRHPFSNSIEQLSRHQASVVGLVINGVQMQAKNYLYGHKG